MSNVDYVASLEKTVYLEVHIQNSFLGSDVNFLWRVLLFKIHIRCCKINLTTDNTLHGQSLHNWTTLKKKCFR
jgi:hypothetical protein